MLAICIEMKWVMDYDRVLFTLTHILYVAGQFQEYLGYNIYALYNTVIRVTSYI